MLLCYVTFCRIFTSFVPLPDMLARGVAQLAAPRGLPLAFNLYKGVGVCSPNSSRCACNSEFSGPTKKSTLGADTSDPKELKNPSAPKNLVRFFVEIHRFASKFGRRDRRVNLSIEPRVHDTY